MVAGFPAADCGNQPIRDRDPGLIVRLRLVETPRLAHFRFTARSGEAWGNPRVGEQRKASADKRGDVAPLKKAVSAAENTVSDLQANIAGYDKKLADDTLYTRDPAKAARLAKERGKLLKDLEAAEAAWLMASETYEAAVSVPA